MKLTTQQAIRALDKWQMVEGNRIAMVADLDAGFDGGEWSYSFHEQQYYTRQDAAAAQLGWTVPEYERASWLRDMQEQDRICAAGRA